MVKDTDEDEKAEEIVEKMEEENLKKPEGVEIIVCPKCLRPVTNDDYLDQLSNSMETSIVMKIECPKCGYVGMPIEVEPTEIEAKGPKKK